MESVTKMRRKGKKKRNGKKSHALPIAIVAPLAMPAITNVVPKIMGGDMKGAVNSLALEYAGYDGKSFRASQVAEWAIPTMVGYVIHRGANKLGINKWARKLSMGFLEI